MKRLYTILSVAASVMLTMASCYGPDDYIYQDPASIDTEEAVYSVVQNDLLSPSFRIIELAEVFSGYQEIRSNREQALDYVYDFLGTKYRIYYEFMDIDRWGRIDLNSDGTYTVKPDYWKYYWIACNMNRTVQIEMPVDHAYNASGMAENSQYDFSADVADNTITMSELHVSYTTDLFGKPIHFVKLDILEPLQMPMCKNGKGKLEPVAGKIQIDYQSKDARRTFQVEFHETDKTIILPDGSTRVVEPEEAHGWNEY